MDDNVLNFINQTVLGLMISGELKACFKICVTKPSSDLTAYEKQCLAMCQDRYQEVFQKTFFKQYENLARDATEGQKLS
jgi:Tim10/DDP family zinc finger